MAMKGRKALNFILISLSVLICPTASQDCINIDESINLTVSSVVNDQVLTPWTVYKAPIVKAMEMGIEGIVAYPAPKQVRAWLGVMSSAFSAMAYYQETSLDFFGRNDVLMRRCTASNITEILDAHALESFSYAYLWGLQKFVPEWSEVVTEYADLINVSLTRCSDVNTEECNTNTPIGLARRLFVETERVFQNDGWNADGSMNRTYNRFEFEDWRKSSDQPSHSSLCISSWKFEHEKCSFWDFDFNDNVCWIPQKYEFGGKIYEEKYAFLHVADSARSYFLGDEAICDLSLPYPCYLDLGAEADEVIRRVRESDDQSRADVEFFDNVWNWMNFFLTAKYDLADQQGFSQWDIINSITSTAASMYETTLAVFKVKLEHGVIRPKSLIRSMKTGDKIDAWIGPNEGLGSIDRSDWVPYLKDAPYPENPTLKGCMCASFTRSMQSFTNSANIGAVVTVNSAAGSSTIETNEPNNDESTSYSTWRQIFLSCKEARLNSGNHFQQSVDFAEELCDGATNSVMEVFLNMNNGIPPANAIDVDKLELQTKRCTQTGDVTVSVEFDREGGDV